MGPRGVSVVEALMSNPGATEKTRGQRGTERRGHKCGDEEKK